MQDGRDMVEFPRHRDEWGGSILDGLKLETRCTGWQAVAVAESIADERTCPRLRSIHREEMT